MSEYDNTSYIKISMKNLKIYLGFLLLTIFNGFVWVNLFENYKDFHEETLVGLQSENNKLKQIVEEFKL